LLPGGHLGRIPGNSARSDMNRWGEAATRAVLAQHKMLHLVEDMVEALNAMAAHAAGQTMKRLAAGLDL